MPVVASLFKNPLLLLLSAGMACLLSGGPALSHPHGPVKLVPLDAEVAFTFEYNGAEYEVFNTHLINFIGLERIEVRNESGNVVVSRRRLLLRSSACHRNATAISSVRS